MLPSIALAGLELGFDPPSEVALFSRAATLEVKATAPGDDCAAAAATAMEDLRDRAKKSGAPTLLTASIQSTDGEDCSRKRTGKTVLQSTVVVSGVAVAEVAGLPKVAAGRALALAAGLGGALGGMERAGFVALDGGVWLRWPDAPAGGAGSAEREVSALLAWSLQRTEAWEPWLLTAPEVAGVVFEAGDAGKKGSGAARVLLPTAVGRDYRAGALTDDEVVAATSFAWAAPGASFVPLAREGVVLGDGGAAVQLRDRGALEGDLEGLDDEATP